MLKRKLIVLSLIAIFASQLSAKYIYSYNRTFEVSYTYFHSLSSSLAEVTGDEFSVVENIFGLYNFAVYVPLPLQLGISLDYGMASDSIAESGLSTISHYASYKTLLLTYEFDDHHRVSVGGRLHGAYSDTFSGYNFESTLGYVAAYEFFIGEHGLMAAGISYELATYKNTLDNQSYTQQNIKAHLKFGLRGLRGLLGIIKGSI